MALTTAAQSILRKHALAQAGELPPAFWLLIDRYRSELVNQAFSILGNPADAEDVAQETLCEAYLHHEDLSDTKRWRRMRTADTRQPPVSAPTWRSYKTTSRRVWRRRRGRLNRLVK